MWEENHSKIMETKMNFSETYQPTNLEISFTETDSVLRVKLAGSMNESSSERTRQTFKKLTGARQENVIFDMEHVTEITASEIGKLLVLHKLLQKQNRKFIIEKIHDDVFSLFSSIYLDKLFEILEK